MPADDLSLIADNLNTSLIGRRVIYYPSLASTMTVGREKARQGAEEGTVIMAGEQSAGRGRMSRIWYSPPGNIALSVILYPDVSSLPYLVMLASVAVARSIEAVTGLKSQIKWPNDVLINGKKVCGILVESRTQGDRVIYAILGIGININLHVAGFPGILGAATSLNDELGREVPRIDLARSLLVEIERLYLPLPDGKAIFSEWQQRLVTLGKRVDVKTGDIALEGIAESVDTGGALFLRLDDGRLIRVIAGDVTLR